MNNVMCERDLLYPTANLFEFGSVHVSILGPTGTARIPVIIEEKTAHSPLKNIDSIISIMQSDIFDRIHVSIKKNVTLYIKVDELLTPELEKYNYVKVEYLDDKPVFTGVTGLED